LEWCHVCIFDLRLQINSNGFSRDRSKVLLQNWFQTILRRLQMIFWSCNWVALFRIWGFGRWWRGNFHILDNGSCELYQFSAIRSHDENWYAWKIEMILVRGCVIRIALSSAINNSGFTLVWPWQFDMNLVLFGITCRNSKKIFGIILWKLSKYEP
jgi:hypothetical protein